jgi:hypothetical protein
MPDIGHERWGGQADEGFTCDAKNRSGGGSVTTGRSSVSWRHLNRKINPYTGLRLCRPTRSVSSTRRHGTDRHTRVGTQRA